MNGDRIFGAVSCAIIGLIVIFGPDFPSRGGYIEGAHKIFLGVLCLVFALIALLTGGKQRRG
jgi:hypothetical protein